VYLTRLTELTVYGQDAKRDLLELMCSSDKPVLPASLLTLRQEYSCTLSCSADGR